MAATLIAKKTPGKPGSPQLPDLSMRISSRAGFPLTVIQVEERARYLGARDQGHAGQRLELQTLVAGAVERSLDLVAGGK